MGAYWSFVAATTGGDAIGELTEAHNRKLTFKLGDAAEASFTLDGRHEQAAVADELTTDLVAYRNDRRLFRGRLGTSSDDIGADGHGVNYSAVDYRGVLARVPLSSPTAPWTFTNVDQATIVGSLVSWAQGLAGANYGITVNAPATGVARTVTFPVGKHITECIDELADLSSGFEWEIDGDLVLRLFHPQRGAERDFVLEYGSTASAVRRSFDPSDYGNAVLVTGAEGVASVVRTVADIATRPEKRITYLESYPDQSSASFLASRADAALAARSAIRPAYVVTLMPETWQPWALWLGDVTWLVVRSGRLDFARAERVLEISIDISDEGEESVVVTLGAVPPRLAARLRATAARLNKLERLGA